MKISMDRRKVDWGHLAFLSIIGGVILCYLFNAMSVSMDIHNLLLVAPLSVVGFIFCLAILPQCFKKVDHTESAVESGPSRTMISVASASDLQTADPKELLLIGSVAASLGAYVFLLNVIGFDIATWLFSLSVMFVCGERRP